MNRVRRPLVAGNWKMHHGGGSGIDLAMQVARIAPHAPHVDLVVAPPFTALAAVSHELSAAGDRVKVAAQNLFPKLSGAYTGEISPSMLKESGCAWVILGHSERRQHFAETDAQVAEKVNAAFEAGLHPIVCIGEMLEEREAGKTLEVVHRQLDAFLEELVRPGGAALEGAIAYEPVWAIGTGKTASPRDAEEVHAEIRRRLSGLSPALAERTRVLYGGSVKPDNAHELLACANVDGALVGGASLDARAFGAIAAAAESLAGR